MKKRRRDWQQDRRRRKRRAAANGFERPIADAIALQVLERAETAREVRQTLAYVVAQGRGQVADQVAPNSSDHVAIDPVAANIVATGSVATVPVAKLSRIPDRIVLLPEPPPPVVEPVAIAPAMAALLSPGVAHAAPPVDAQSAPRADANPPAAAETIGQIPVGTGVDQLSLAPGKPTPGALRRFIQALLLPVVMAAAAILVSNHFAPTFRPGAFLTPAPVAPVHVSDSGGPARDGVGLAAVRPIPVGEAIAPVESAPQVAASEARDGAVAALDTDFLPRTRACTTAEIAAFRTAPEPSQPSAFGTALAAAAEAQIRDFVIYNDEYYNIRYPGGDIPALYGVCSDVVIRAYRTLGIDLQKLVHEARVGSGDSSIDHRRTETLRRFFARHATALAVTDFAEDFQPGDIVTYERPQNRGAQAHIAIVASETGPSGRLMIIHNRGWGPQMEDALFVDHMTGHYRLSGQPRLLTSWGKGQNLGQGMESWATLVRRAAIQRGAARSPKDQAKKNASNPAGLTAN